MSQYPDSYSAYGRGLEYESGADTMTVGQFFNMVYAWMCVGLALTAVVAWYVSQSSLLLVIYGGKGGYVALLLGAFVLAMYVQSQAGRMSAGVATVLFLLYCAIIGALISGIYKVYPTRMLAASFVMTGGVFGAMSLYGFVTKRDLSRIGSILIMGAFGLFAASLVNLWLANDPLSWVITYAVLAVFIGITAYETQQLRQIALQLHGNARLAQRYAIVGSLVLYISFMNMFMSILRIMGDRR
jgi:FtsH-binding integral membrane protein